MLEGLTLYEALDDAATYLRNDGLANLAAAVERAATLIGQPPAHAPERQVVAESPELNRVAAGELARAVATLRELHGRPREAAGASTPGWLQVIDQAIANHLGPTGSPAPTTKNLEAAHDALAIVGEMGTPDDVGDLIRATLAAMPRARRRFGGSSDVAHDDDGR